MSEKLFEVCNETVTAAETTLAQITRFDSLNSASTGFFKKPEKNPEMPKAKQALQDTITGAGKLSQQLQLDLGLGLEQASGFGLGSSSSSLLEAA